MVTIKNKFLILAAGFWVLGLVLVLTGAWVKIRHADMAGTLLSLGILAQAIGFGFFGYVVMQAVLKKK